MLSSEKLLHVWEAGLDRRPLVRGVELLRAAGAAHGGDDPAALPLGARDLRLLNLREQTFGRQINGIANCPDCGEAVEMHFTVDDVRLATPKTASDLTIVAGGYAIRFRLPSTSDLMTVDFVGEEEEDGRRLFQRCIADASWQGRPVRVEDLPEAVQNAVAESMTESDPQAEIDLALECPACSTTWRELFDIESFFWNELQAWAAHMLREIHQLASAYGWSEREILTLSPLRRSIYLNLITE